MPGRPLTALPRVGRQAVPRAHAGAGGASAPQSPAVGIQGDLRALARRRDRRGDPRMAGEGVVSEPVRLTLPWSVLVPVNRRTNPAGWGKMRGRQFLTREYRDAQRTAELLVQSQVRGKRPRFTAPVAMTLRFYEPDRRRRDPSNLLKLVEDALTGVVYDDDSRI